MSRADDPCVAFLQWALPELGLRWAGFRKVRRHVCRRLRRRLEALGLPDLDAYRAHLEAHPDEWRALERLTTITISRFARDRVVVEALGREVLPALARQAVAEGRDRLRAWSAGCASGEEPYSVALLWPAIAADVPHLGLEVLATDVDPVVLRRAERAAYPASSLRELAPAVRAEGLQPTGDLHVVRPEHARRVRFARHDLRTPPPPGPFDLVLCRNVAFTYFAPESQRAVLGHLASALRPGGALVVGLHETLPERTAAGFEPWPGARAVHRRRAP